MNLLIKITFLAIIILIASCTEEENPVQQNTTLQPDYLPLVVGAKWYYETTHSNLTMTEEILELDSEGYYKVKAINLFPGEIYTYFKKNENSGVKIFSIEKDFILYELKKPYIEASTWGYETSYYTLVCTIVDDNVTETVPAGTFENCIKVAYSYEDTTGTFLSTEYYSYAPNVGLIKTDFYQLENYTIP